jgi:biotin transport system substrate-specific component
MKTLAKLNEVLKQKALLAVVLKVLFATSILTISAKISIPFPFVPLTGQTLGVLVIALSFGAKIATSAVALYIFEGVAGLPVFAESSFGLAVLLGSSGGYLFGFLVAAFFIGYHADKGCLTSFSKTLLATLGGMAIIYAFGLAQLALFVPANKVLIFGLYPFLLGEIVKIALATLIIPQFRKHFGEK